MLNKESKRQFRLLSSLIISFLLPALLPSH
ncbi:hypothetical protein ACT7DP_18665 [Bacillus paranthracis]